MPHQAPHRVVMGRKCTDCVPQHCKINVEVQPCMLASKPTLNVLNVRRKKAAVDSMLADWTGWALLLTPVRIKPLPSGSISSKIVQLLPLQRTSMSW